MDFTGGKYDGETGGGRFDGHGTYTFPDGSKYVGQFKHGMFHGKGVIHNDVGSFAAVWDYGKVRSRARHGCGHCLRHHPGAHTNCDGGGVGVAVTTTRW